MRVCYTLHAANLTGASRSLLDMVVAVRNLGVDPIVMLPREGALRGVLEGCGIECVVLRYHNSIHDVRKAKTLAKRAIRPLELQKLKSAIRASGADLVHNNSLISDIGMEAARELKLPYVCHIRELVEESQGFTFLKKDRTRALARDSACGIAISSFVSNKFANWFDQGKLSVIPNGLDITTYRLNRNPILSGNTCQLLLAGLIAPNKGQLEAIQATEILIREGYDVKLMIVGGVGRSAKYAERCRQYIASRELSGAVQLHDFKDDLSTLKLQSDISLTCSLFEALGRVTIEGMLAGCLVIGADNGATPEIITDEKTGLLYETGNPESLAGRVAWAIDHAVEAREIACTGQQYAENKYDSTTYAEKLVELYQDCLLGRR